MRSFKKLLAMCAVGGTVGLFATVGCSSSEEPATPHGPGTGGMGGAAGAGAAAGSAGSATGGAAGTGGTAGSDAGPEGGGADNDKDGYTVAQGDCDDSNAAVHPGQTEVCNGVDDDCENGIDDGLAQSAWYKDVDKDGYGSTADSQQACGKPDGDWVEQDGDCDDENAEVNPGATEVCNGIDDDCKNDIDDGVTTIFYADGDGDNYGLDATATNKNACQPPTGYVAVAGDCDDAQPLAFPGNPEVCDGIDNDCGGGVDNGVALDTYYQDSDGDGYGNSSITQKGCEKPSGAWVLEGSDCADNDPQRYPGNPEVCDGKDNDCDTSTPDPGLLTWYLDADNDGYGATTGSQQACAKPTGNWLLQGGDCQDKNAAINPGAIELCDGIDNNCINGTDEGPLATYDDADGDGYGAKTATVEYMCEVKAGHAANNTDCNDKASAVNPGATEIPGNGVDENCDGVDTNAGSLCGGDATAVTSLPAAVAGILATSDSSTGGPMGAGYYWDDIEVSTTAGQAFTVLYGSTNPSTLNPRLYTYGPNSCTTLLSAKTASSQGSPKGLYLASHVVKNSAAGYYYNALTSGAAGQLGAYDYEVIPGDLQGSCGNDTTITWPLGWRKAGSLTASDVESAGTPVPAGYYGDDFEFYLTSGKTYSLLMGGTNFLERMYLARAGACGTSLASSASGIANGGAKIVTTPTQTGIYAAFLTSTTAGVTGSYVFNVVEGDLGKMCFDGSGSLGGNGDAEVYYPLNGALPNNALAIGDRAGDFGSRYFDDYETYLEAGDIVAVTMTRTTGTWRPRIYLTRAGACTSVVASAVAPVAGNKVTLNYTVPSGGSGVYALSFSSYELSAAGSYSVTASLN